MIEYRNLRIRIDCGELIGAGGFGEVFLATERDGKRRNFAIKYIKCTDNDELESAEEEIKALIALEHINIVKIFDFGLRQAWECEVEFSLLLEYCPNGTLSSRLGKENARSQKLGWLQDITSAVAYLHSKQITHQDLKPDNVLLAENGHLKIADFGLSRRFARRNEGQSWHSYYLSQGVGALFYVAPEMFGEHHTYKVDIFSMGIIFHAIFEGDYKMYNKERCYGVFVRKNGEKEPIGVQMHEKRADLPVPFRRRRKRLIVRMLKYDPNERPTANDVENVLRSRWRRWFHLGA